MTANNKKEFYIVGVGASAGGLEALEKFFGNMSADHPIAFVVVLHLSPDYKSLMVELLSKRAKMSVHQVADGLLVEPNNIYIIPPNKNITIFHQKLYLSDRDSEHIHLPIDIFLESLAKNNGEKAIAIILSGTGSDGTRGVRAVKEKGGMVMVQQPNSAKFDGMPRSAIATKLVDYILPAEQMGPELIRYLQHPLHKQLPNTIEESDSLGKIYNLLHSQLGVDFTDYKQSTMVRRIERRISVNQLASVDEYVRYLHQYPSEIKVLYQELLIGVTRFFREADAFKVIEQQVIPVIFEQKSRRDPVRVWVAGCSTGEEAYSLAILFTHYMEKSGKLLDIKIFATDIDREALDFASRGLYTESTIADVPIHFLQNYFVRKNDRYEVISRIREMVIFAQQDLTKDPPFSKIDLITCRNVLIYLKPTLQQRVLTTFQFSLLPGGHLFLGSSETVGNMSDIFLAISAKHRIFSYQGGPKPILSHTGQPSRNRSFAQVEQRFNQFAPVVDPRLTEKLYHALLEAFTPATVVTDEGANLLHAFGEIDAYLRVPSGGQLSLNILKMVRGTLSIPLSTAINRALKTDEEVVYNNLGLELDGQKQVMRLVVRPFTEATNKQTYLFIQFQPVDEGSKTAVDPETSFSLEESVQQRIADLEQELQYNKENLQATIEELETANEELQATNEELLAANEELQSTNEELQSVNEELLTVNSEYQAKIQELIELNADINNLFSSTNIGIIFLDKLLQIRKFTPAAQKEINLLESDIGRPIAHIAHQINEVDLVKQARDVLNTQHPLQQEITTQHNNQYLLKILPFYTVDQIVNGVTIVLIDINDLFNLRQKNKALRDQQVAFEASQQALQTSYDFLESIIDALAEHIAILDKTGTILAVNAAWRQFADENGMGDTAYGVGQNYITLSEQATGEGAAESHQIAHYLRAMVAGERETFSVNYPCHAPHEKRWFLAHATTFTVKNEVYFVLVHSLTKTEKTTQP